MSQHDKVMIITGASSGFGATTARMAVRQGYRLVVTARRADRLDALVQELTQAGGEAVSVAGDITDTHVQQEVISTAVAHYGRIDVLLNNAGVPLQKGFIDESLDDLRRQWETNVVSLVTLARLALPVLLQTRGVIINIGSLAGHFSIPGWGMYFPTKVAVASLSDMLRRELGPRGVHVCLIEPGAFRTEFGDRAGVSFEGGGQPEQVAQAILRVAARPRSRTVVPFWLGPFAAVAGGLSRALPGLVDVGFWLAFKWQTRQKAINGGETPLLDETS